ncbi:hypothetical protein SLE2022_058790 [Rubroshorea leprosula]
MEKLSFKLVFLGALLMFLLGGICECDASPARLLEEIDLPIGRPCNTSDDCLYPACGCNPFIGGECECDAFLAKLFEEISPKHPEVQKKVP